MASFREYIWTQNDGGKPLYQWAKYTDYDAISRVVSDLDESMTKFKQARLLQEFVAVSINQGTGHSMSVSRATAFALRVMSEKTEKYTEELEDSTLSTEAKTNAHSHIIEEVRGVHVRFTCQTYADSDSSK
jgi:hypothetical protein